MKVKIEIDPFLPQDEILIRCSQVDERILKLQQALNNAGPEKNCISLQDGDTGYYVPLDQILFFETEGKKNSGAHSSEAVSDGVKAV